MAPRNTADEAFPPEGVSFSGERKLAVEHLREALDDPDSAEAEYHIRQALQSLVVEEAEEPLP